MKIKKRQRLRLNPLSLVIAMKNTNTDITSLESTEEEAAVLGDVYAFLSLTMRYPDASFLDNDFLNAFETLLESMGLEDQLKELIKWRQQSSDPIDELQIEYTRLFINAVSSSTYPPFASVYMDGDGTLQGKTTEKIKDFYQQCGYAVENQAEPPDHIRFELEFLAALAHEGRFEEEEEFLTTLFRPWFERFIKKSIHEARHPYYRASIQLIDFFTQEEQ